jgi:ribosomal protein S18 acetylase RimI-like enzyme
MKFYRLRESFRWQGPWITFIHGMKTAVRPLIEINRFLFFEADLTQPLVQVEPRIPLEMHCMTARDIEAFAALFGARGLDPETINHRLTQGDICILACSGAQLVGFHWLGFSSQWLSEIGVTLRLAPGVEAYGYDAVTFPAWRGNRIHAAMALYASQYARARGNERYVTYVRADNPRSLRTTVGRLGRKRTKTIWSIRVAGRQRPILLFGAKGPGSPSFDTGADTGGINDDASVIGTGEIVRPPITASVLADTTRANIIPR